MRSLPVTDHETACTDLSHDPQLSFLLRGERVQDSKRLSEEDKVVRVLCPNLTDASHGPTVHEIGSV